VCPYICSAYSESEKGIKDGRQYKGMMWAKCSEENDEESCMAMKQERVRDGKEREN
jgi:hypothetical protein